MLVTLTQCPCWGEVMAYTTHPPCTPQTATRGLDPVEELDPLERMRKRYGLDAAAEQRRLLQSVPIPSLEEELLKTQREVNIKDFDYVPVPRTEDEEG